eukprot:5560127-Pleurochrysis_carterae.AAC.2
MNYHIAKALAVLRPEEHTHFSPPSQSPASSLPIPVAVTTPVQPDAPSQPSAQDSAPEPPDEAPSRPQHFQRGLGSFPLQSSALLVTRRHVPHNVRIRRRARSRVCFGCPRRFLGPSHAQASYDRGSGRLVRSGTGRDRQS